MKIIKIQYEIEIENRYDAEIYAELDKAINKYFSSNGLC
jgi:hypothetical protein